MIDREGIGKRLIYSAWAVEIVAAFIGLTIAALIIAGTYEALKQDGEGFSPSGYMDMFLGGLPFIVVAMVELTKIPLATACYTAINRIWKLTFAFVLILLSIITFETMLNGFERNFTQRTYLITTDRQHLRNVEEKIKKAQDEIVTLTNFTDEDLRSAYQSDVEQINSERGGALQDIEDQREDLRSAYQSDVEQINSERGVALQDIDNQRMVARIRFGGEESKVKITQAERIQKDIIRRENSQNAELETINQRYQLQLETIDETVNQRRITFENLIQKLETKIFNSRQNENAGISSIQEGPDYSDEQEREILRIESSFKDRVEEIKQEILLKRTDLQDEIRRLGETIEEVEKNKQVELDNSFFTRDQIRSDFDDRLLPMRSSLTQRTKELSELSAQTQIRQLDARKDVQISEVRVRFEALSSRADREKKEIRTDYSQDRESDEVQLRRYRNELAGLSTASQIDIANNTRDDDIKRLTSEYDEVRDKLIVRKNALDEAVSKILFESRENLNPVLERLDSRRAVVVDQYADRLSDRQVKYDFDISRIENGQIDLGKYAARLLDRQVKYDFDISRIENAQIELDNRKNDLDALGDQRISIRDEIGNKARDSQIYRIASLWSGKDDPADVSNDELRMVTIIWFGSLAMITAWTGTFLAFGGLVVRYGPQSRKPSKLTQSIRRYFVDRRRRVRKPVVKEIEKEVVRTVEVVKEVPVDKIVFKEVPKEVVRRELVYVPFFTDDPELVRKQMSKQTND